MRVTFYDCGSPYLGIQYLLRVCKDHGHEVSLFYDNSFTHDHLAQDFFFRGFLSLSTEQICREIMKPQPQVVCFSMFTNSYQSNLEILRMLKNEYPEVIIICGGVHTTLLPKVVLENKEVDFAVVGEAERSLPELLNALTKAALSEVKVASCQALPGVWNRINGGIVERGLSPIVHNLDEIPFPEKGLHVRVNPALSGVYTMVASRGCFFKCTFCDMPALNQRYRDYHETLHRVRSVDNVMAEIHQAIELFGPHHVEFYDDCFGAKRSWLREFCRRYKSEVGLPFGIQTSPRLHDTAILDLLADAGMQFVEYGMQAVNPEVRNSLLDRHETNQEVLDMVHHARKRGMFVELDLIMNLPGETLEHVEEAIAFVQNARPHWVNLSFLQYLPCTTIVDVAREKRILTDEDVNRLERGQLISSFRLLSKSNLTPRYRILPYQIVFAFAFSKRISPYLIKLVNLPGLRMFFSSLASYFIYVSRAFIGFVDRRDIFLRRQVIRGWYGARWILRKKFALRSNAEAP